LQTIYQSVDSQQPEAEVIRQAAELLCLGEVVAFPTETVYGLGANALDPQAVEKIFLAKGRPSDNPLIVHIAGMDGLLPLVREIPAAARLLMDHFWPGPLTLIFPKSPQVPDSVTAGLDTVAVRMPSHPVALALIRQAGVPVAAPSANVSGRPSPTNGRHVWEDLDGRVAMVLDGGATEVGLESTVLDMTRQPPMILRPGGVTAEAIREVIGEVAVDPGHKPGQAPRSPGMKYTHYAPKAELTMVSGMPETLAGCFDRLCREEQSSGRRVALLLAAETAAQMADLADRAPADYLEVLGSRQDLATVARRMFAAFRHADAQGVDVILVETFAEEGMGQAVMNRMRKAAGGRIIRCDQIFSV